MMLRFLLLLIFPFVTGTSMAQKKDSLKTPEPLKATANLQLTNNGLSLFPNLSLGKPAAIINLTVGKKRIFFEPELRWGLNGKPWSYIYWLRYKYRSSGKFGFNIGAHPSYVFKENTFTINNKNENRYVSQRYVAGELVPTWYPSKKFALTLYLLYSEGLDSYAVQQSTFLSLMPRFPRIDLSKDTYLSFYPQFFFLKMDDKKGYYTSETLTLNRDRFPIALSSVFTYKINSTIPGDKVVWNIGLNFKF